MVEIKKEGKIQAIPPFDLAHMLRLEGTWIGKGI